MDARRLMKLAGDDYLPDVSIFATDDESVHKIKQALQRLPLADRTIIVLYAETASLRKVAEILNVSHTTIRKELRRIRKELSEIILWI